MSIVRRLTLTLALAGAAMLDPASAAPGTVSGAFAGAGTVTPGFTFVPTYQQWAASATLVGPYVVPSAVAVGALCYVVAEGWEAVAGGSGSGYARCEPFPTTAWGDKLECSFSYARAGTHVTFLGSCVGYNGTVPVTAGPMSATYDVFWTTINPVVSYQLAGAFAFTGT